MLLTTTITKKSCYLVTADNYNITLNLLYKDGEDTLLDLDFTEPWSTGQIFSSLFFSFKARMMAAIANYKLEQSILNGGGLAAIETNLNNTVGV